MLTSGVEWGGCPGDLAHMEADEPKEQEAGLGREGKPMFFLCHWCLTGLKRSASAQGLALRIVEDHNALKHLPCKPHSMGTIIGGCLEALALGTGWEATRNGWGPFPTAKHPPHRRAVKAQNPDALPALCLSHPCAVQFMNEEVQPIFTLLMAAGESKRVSLRWPAICIHTR